MCNLTWSTPVPSDTDVPAISNWYEDLFFTDKLYTYQFIRTMGYAYSDGADIGECIKTSKVIPDADKAGWYQQWLSLADKTSNFADKMQKNNDIPAAREAYLKATNYYRTAAAFTVNQDEREKSVNVIAQSKASFLNAISSMPFIQPIKIPYESTALPGYLIRAPFKNAPLLIVTTGMDGTAEELYFEVGIAAYQRGYNVLLFEGPGQGSVLRKLNLPFRYDWEHVITPVIDYAMEIPDINKNKIALMGVSLGGYFAARAAAFDKRIKACVVNSGVYNLYDSVLKNFPDDLIKLSKDNPGKFNQDILNEMKNNISLDWFINYGMWVFDASTPADLLTKLQAYNLEGIASKIKSPVLIVESDADIFFKGQAKQLFDALTSPKTMMLFTAEDAAQAHCQAGAIAISNEKIFHWLSDILS